MKVVVTGAAGMVGANLLRGLNAIGVDDIIAVDDLTEGAQQENVVATYLHGPVLVRNPALADLMLSRAVGTLPEYVDEAVECLRAERLDAADPRHHRARRALLGH